MADNKAIAQGVLDLVGGPANVSIATNCMTRLRLTLKDNSVVDLDKIKEIPGVLGAQFSGTQLQVIIGPQVVKVIDEFVAISGVQRGDAVDENLDAAPAEKFKWTPANVGNAIMDYLSGSMTQLIPLFMAGGLFRTIAVALGPQLLNLIAEDSLTYQFLYTTLYEAAFYFLPIYLGYAAAKKLGASQPLGMLLGGILIAPSIIAAASVEGGSMISVYGIETAAANYSQSVLPILLSVPVMAIIEKNIRKVMPDALQAVFTPFFTMAITIPISLLALAPLGNLVGNAIGNLLFSVADLGPFGILIVMAILGAFWQLFVVAGMHMPIIMLAIVQITQVGYDPYIFVSTNCAMFAVWGVTIGAFLRIKNKEERGLIAGHFIAAALGGVTEPALFGIIMRWKRTMLGMFAGGALGAVVSGILGVVSYMAGGGTNFMIVLNYLQGGQENVIKALIGIVISIVVAAVVTFLFGFSKEDLEKING